MKKFLKKSFATTAALLAGGSTLAGTYVTVVSAEAPKPLVTLEPEAKHEGEAIEGGTLKYALVGEGFEGLLNSLVSENADDNSIITWFNPGLFGYDESFNMDDSGFGQWELDVENKKVTITIPEGHKWDDGEPITIDDVIYPYYVIGHPDYPGVRYGTDFENVVGMEEYHNGETDEISGLNRVDDYTLEVTYNTVTNSMLKISGGISNYIEPKHIVEQVEVKDLQDADFVRSKPVGFGAFKVKQITPGESILLEANENYYKGRPNIDQVQIDVVSASTVIQEMNNGNYDIASLPSDQYETFKDAQNYTVIGDVQNAYTYIGFKFGKYNADTGENEIDETRIVNNLALRQAMAYAIDNDAVGEKFYQGLRFRANSPITPNFTDVYDAELEGHAYNPEKAQEILAEAGFVDNNGDGFVEDPEGNEFVLDFASMSGSDIAEPLAQYYIDAWAAVGIHVQLMNGRLMEMNAFYDSLQADDQEIDVYQGAWTVGGDPNPNGLYGRKARFNYTRYATEEMDALLTAIESDAAFEDEVRIQAFKDWQAYIDEQLPVIPTLYRTAVYAVNKRVSQYDIKVGSDLDWTDIYLTAEEPVK